MSRDVPDEVVVELDDAALGGPVTVGHLRRTRASGGSIAAFAYDETWLARADAFVIDPKHGLYSGDQWPATGSIDRIFTDAATDRWGRTLMDRREALDARTDGRARRTLEDWDYLLGVSDALDRWPAVARRANLGSDEMDALQAAIGI